jgi:hypothetical protein
MVKRLTKSREYAAVQRFAIGGLEWDSGPLSLIMYARDFAQAAIVLKSPPDGSYAPARYSNACRAIELALKAYLALQGRPVAELVDAYGHRLTPALDDAIAAGLLDYPALPLMLKGFSDRPEVTFLVLAAEALTDALYEPCLAHANK